MCWNVCVGIYGQRLCGYMSLISHPYGDLSAPYLGITIFIIFYFEKKKQE